MSQRASVAFHMVRASYYIRRLGLPGVYRFCRDYLKNYVGPTGRLIAVTSPQNGVMTVRSRTSDFDVYFQTFYVRESDVSGFAQGADLRRRYEEILARGKTPVVIDGGGNIGTVSALLAATFPRAQIVLIEPDAKNLEMARLNTERVGNVALRRSALWSSPGMVTFASSGDAPNAITVTPRPKGEASDSNGVVATTIDGVLAEYPAGELLLMKIDIEGAESEALSADAAWTKSVPVCIIEPHDWMLPGHASLKKLLAIPAFRNGDIVLSGENLVFFPAR